VQIRSHAQKYLIKICKKYKIKLSTKKINNKDSKQLKVSENEIVENSNIAEMNNYGKNIIRLFNYYHRELAVLKDEILSNAIGETIKKTNIKLHTIKNDSINLNLNEADEDYSIQEEKVNEFLKNKNK
jgi:hypothetical protein